VIRLDCTNFPFRCIPWNQEDGRVLENQRWIVQIPGGIEFLDDEGQTGVVGQRWEWLGRPGCK
jgi:hypothetical protein